MTQTDPSRSAPQRGVVSIRTIAMPADTNPSGDIFGGWLMSQMDMAGGTHARHLAEGRVVTVAVDGFLFHRPVFVGDWLTCYSHHVKTGRTSLTIQVEAWAQRAAGGANEKVTEGTFVFVAIDTEGRARSVPAGVEDREAALVGTP